MRLLATNEHAPWGRVDETGTVFVREGGGRARRRPVSGRDCRGGACLLRAQVHRTRRPGDAAGTAREARHGCGGRRPDHRRLKASIASASAVGDLAALTARLDALGGAVGELTEKQTAESKAALDAALAERTAIVEKVEALAAQDPAKAQWKQVSAALDDIFARWQKQQRDGPRLPKSGQQRALEAVPCRAHHDRDQP